VVPHCHGITNKYPINGLLAPFLRVAILIVAADKKLVQFMTDCPASLVFTRLAEQILRFTGHYIFKVRSVPIAQAFSHAYEQICRGMSLGRVILPDIEDPDVTLP
jgi:hypothetical protein